MTALAYAVALNSSKAPFTAPAYANRVEIDLVLYAMGALALAACVVFVVIMRRLQSRTTRRRLPMLSLMPLGAAPLLPGRVGRKGGPGNGELI
jgi:hypothetical protein